jgi:hypothetical protein
LRNAFFSLLVILSVISLASSCKQRESTGSSAKDDLLLGPDAVPSAAPDAVSVPDCYEGRDPELAGRYTITSPVHGSILGTTVSWLVRRNSSDDTNDGRFRPLSFPVTRDDTVVFHIESVDWTTGDRHVDDLEWRGETESRLKAMIGIDFPDRATGTIKIGCLEATITEPLTHDPAWSLDAGEKPVTGGPIKMPSCGQAGQARGFVRLWKGVNQGPLGLTEIKELFKKLENANFLAPVTFPLRDTLGSSHAGFYRFEIVAMDRRSSGADNAAVLAGAKEELQQIMNLNVRPTCVSEASQPNKR